MTADRELPAGLHGRVTGRAGIAYRAARIAWRIVAACLRNPGDDVESIMAYANAVAALNCRGLGARGGMPRAGEVEAMLMVRPRA